MGKKINVTPIHEQIWNTIKKTEKNEMYVNELYSLIENNHNYIKDKIQKKIYAEAIKLGFTDRQVQYLINNIRKYLRFSRNDSRKIICDFNKLGWIERHQHKIYIKK